MVTVFFLVPRPVRAADEFSTAYDVNYDIGTDGVTTVTEKITLKNLTSQYYATEFKLTIGVTQITDVKVSDSGGILQAQLSQQDSSTTIAVKFNQQVAGVNKAQVLNLQFKSTDFAQKMGKVWEISIPKVVSAANLESYNLIISVPNSFGEPTLITPLPKGEYTNAGKINMSFDKDQLGSTGVSAEFGTNQLFNFDLSYNLENPNIVPVITSIALPPDTAYQDLIYQRIEPKPLNVTVDDDGNYLAWYRLGRNEKIKVNVIGSAKIYNSLKVENITLDQKLAEKYLQSDKYWEKDNPAIASKVKEILGPNSPKSNTDKARLIHRYVAGFLKYDSSRLNSGGIERLGAVTALNNSSTAVCMEFTDLFIAMARAAGIPAREVDGYAYTTNTKLRPLSLSKDILHAWPEYFDPAKGWVMVDPTWENTTGGVDYFSKLDLNHFAFVIHGSSSSQPVPAGSYKYLDQNSHDVKVMLSNEDFLGKPQLSTTINNSEPLLAGFPEKINVKIVNNGNAVAIPGSLSIQANRSTILNGSIENIGPIPPFGYASFDFNIRTASLFDSFDDMVKVELAGQRTTKDVMVRPFVAFKSFPILIGLAVALVTALYFTILARFIYRKRVKKK